MSYFEVGDVVRDIDTKRYGMIVYIHPTEEQSLIIDYGESWWGRYEDDVTLATPKQNATFIKKYGDRSRRD